MKKYFALFGLIVLVLVAAAAVFLPFESSEAQSDLGVDPAEPDMPRIWDRSRSTFGKEEFLKERADAYAIKRGIIDGKLPDPGLRSAAVQKMANQEAARDRLPDSFEKNALLAAWNPIGPNPIPNGSFPWSGRVISIAVHPTNPNIVYVGAAQGGLYRSTDGGTNWTALMDNALSLAIGAIAISPSQPETIYIGTGEPNFSSDSFFGVGIYRIDNASTTANISGPFNKTAANADHLYRPRYRRDHRPSDQSERDLRLVDLGRRRYLGFAKQCAAVTRYLSFGQRSRGVTDVHQDDRARGKCQRQCPRPGDRPQ